MKIESLFYLFIEIQLGLSQVRISQFLKYRLSKHKS